MLELYSTHVCCIYNDHLPYSSAQLAMLAEVAVTYTVTHMCRTAKGYTKQNNGYVIVTSAGVAAVPSCVERQKATAERFQQTSAVQ